MNRVDINERGPVRPLAWIGLASQVVFVLAWLVAPLWQGPRYSILDDSISDMYAVTAPGGWVLVVLFTLCGAGSIAFFVGAVYPTFRRTGWPALVAVVLLVLCIFGIGDLLSPFERLACRLADPGCTPAAQTSNLGGVLDGTISTIGAFLYMVAGFFVAEAMRRLPDWRRWAWPARGVSILVLLLTVGDGVFTQSGLFERFVALAGAAGIAALALGILRRQGRRTP